MNQELYSVEQVAERLGLHVRTVRGYVRDGRLKAVRIGKQYRISRDDLESFTGAPTPAPDRETVRRARYVEVSSVVQIDAVSPQLASRVSNGLVGALNGRERAADGPTRVDSIYDETRARLKVIIIAGVPTTVGLLQLVHVYLDESA
jgi:excisionase family DNA binding protein